MSTPISPPPGNGGNGTPVPTPHQPGPTPPPSSPADEPAGNTVSPLPEKMSIEKVREDYLQSQNVDHLTLAGERLAAYLIAGGVTPALYSNYAEVMKAHGKMAAELWSALNEIYLVSQQKGSGPR